MASSQSSLVVRALYRGLFRSAKRFDQKPWLRTFLSHHPPFRRLVGGIPFFLGSDSCAATISRVFKERKDLPDSTVSDALSEGFAVMKLLGTLTSRKRAPIEDVAVHPASGSADVKLHEGPSTLPEFQPPLGVAALPFSPAFAGGAGPEVDVEVVAADQLGVETEEVEEEEDEDYEDGDSIFDATVRGTGGQGLGELLQQLPGNVMPIMIRGDAPPAPSVSLSIDVEDALGETHTLADLFVDPRVLNELMGSRIAPSNARSKPAPVPSLFERVPSRGDPFPDDSEQGAVPSSPSPEESTEPVAIRLERVLGKFRADYEAAVAKAGAVVGPDLLPWSVNKPVRGLLAATALVPAAANLPVSIEHEIRSEQQKQLFIQKMRSYFHRAVDEGNLEVVGKCLRVLKPMDVSEDDCNRLLEECYEQDEPWLAVQVLQIMQLNSYPLSLDALSAVTCAAANTGQLPAALTALRASSWGCLFGNINGNPDPLSRSPSDAAVSESSFVPSQTRLTTEIELINHTIVAAARGPFADPELCFELFDTLATHNIRPNKESFESLSKALLLPRRPSPLDTYSTDIRLAEATFLANRKARAASLLKNMRSLGMRPTVSIYNAVLQSAQPDFEESLRLLSRMARDRIAPNSATVAICLRSAVASSKPQNVRLVLDRLQRARYASFGFGPTARYGHDNMRNRKRRRGAATRPRQ